MQSTPNQLMLNIRTSLAKWNANLSKLYIIYLKVMTRVCLVGTYYQCDQIGRFLHFGQLFQAFGNN